MRAATFVTYLAAPPAARGRDMRLAARHAFDRLYDNILDRGAQPLHHLARAEPTSPEIRSLQETGYLRRSGQQLSLTEAALRLGEDALLAELLAAQGGGLPGRHRRPGVGTGAEPGDDVRSLPPGEPLEHLDVSATLSAALRRGLPLNITPDDIHTRPGEAMVRGACVVLLDLSGSMARQGKFALARRATLALRALVRRRFPEDEITVAGFASRAEILSGAALLTATPRNVGLHDPAVASYRLDRRSATVPDHFTNIHAGLDLARRLLRGRSGRIKQVLLVTDGEPTAHLDGDELVLAYPPTRESVEATLREARRCANDRIALSVLSLVDGREESSVHGFVERLAKAGRGVAISCPPRRLGPSLLGRFAAGRSSRNPSPRR